MSSGRIPISEFRRTSREVVRIALDEYQGCPIIDCRCWYGDESELKPGRTGISLSLKHLEALAVGLTNALEEARRRGLIQ